MEVAKQRGILPLVDTVREKDKYGNDGGQTRLAGDIFTRIFEDASRSLSKSLGVNIIYIYSITWNNETKSSSFSNKECIFQEPDSDTVNLLEGLKPALEDLGDSLAGLAWSCNIIRTKQ